MTVYHHMFSSEADDVIRELIKEINPMTTKLFNDVFLNKVLFDKIKTVYGKRNSLESNDRRLLEEVYSSFVRSGANLDSSSKYFIGVFPFFLFFLEGKP